MAAKVKRYFIDESENTQVNAVDSDSDELIEEDEQKLVDDEDGNKTIGERKYQQKKIKKAVTRLLDEDSDEKKKLKKYEKKRINLNGLTTNFQRKKFAQKRKQYEISEKQASRAELLLPEDSGYIEADEGESTSSITQKQIVSSVDITSATKHFELDLKNFGPYRINYTKNGRFLLLGGKQGHVAAFDWLTKDLLCEINVMEHVRDVQWFHNELMFAVAQNRYTYFYDSQGTELHCLKMLNDVSRLEFLPYHFLLVASTAAANVAPFLHWVDVSIGKLVASFPTKVGPLDVMCQNPSNAILHCGQSRGIVSLWSPNVKEPLVKIHCHSSPVRGLTVDQSGRYMATAGTDRFLKIWDLRYYKPLHQYKLQKAAEPIVFSQQGCLGCAVGTEIQIFKDICRKPANSPYLTHSVHEMITDLQFCPYEDVLGVGHRSGFVSLLVPGAGEPNIDAFEANPYQSKKQRREAEVKSLLDKIQPEMITLDSELIGKVDSSVADTLLSKKLKILYKSKPDNVEIHLKHKAKGKSSGVNSFRRKQLIKESNKKEFLNQRKLVEQELIEKGILEDDSNVHDEELSLNTSVLDRFRKADTKR